MQRIFTLVLGLTLLLETSGSHEGMEVHVLRLRGGRKGVSAKHTAKEISEKNKLANKNMGGGKAGLEDRLGGKAGHAK